MVSLTTTVEDINRIGNAVWLHIVERVGNSDDMVKYIDSFSPSLTAQFDTIVNKASQLSNEDELNGLINSLPTNDEFMEVIDFLLYVHGDNGRRRLILGSFIRAVIGRQARKVYKPFVDINYRVLKQAEHLCTIKMLQC